MAPVQVNTTTRNAATYGPTPTGGDDTKVRPYNRLTNQWNNSLPWKGT